MGFLGARGCQELAEAIHVLCSKGDLALLASPWIMVTFKVPIFDLLHVVVTLRFLDPQSPLPPPTGT